MVSIGLILNRNAVVNYLLVVGYLALLITTTVYEYINQGITQLVYFTSDSLGLLMLTAMTIVSIPAFYYGYRFIATRKIGRAHV